MCSYPHLNTQSQLQYPIGMTQSLVICVPIRLRNLGNLHIAIGLNMNGHCIRMKSWFYVGRDRANEKSVKSKSLLIRNCTIDPAYCLQSCRKQVAHQGAQVSALSQINRIAESQNRRNRNLFKVSNGLEF